jgi:hypothetical protein
MAIAEWPLIFSIAPELFCCIVANIFIVPALVLGNVLEELLFAGSERIGPLGESGSMKLCRRRRERLSRGCQKMNWPK